MCWFGEGMFGMVDVAFGAFFMGGCFCDLLGVVLGGFGCFGRP